MSDGPRAAPALWTPGTKINSRYRIDRRIGVGGMGEVYRGEDLILNRTVALKRTFHDDLGREALRSRSLAEARLASQVSSSHIAGVIDVLPYRDELVLVLEFVEGQTLRDTSKTPVDLETFCRIALQLCSAIESIHSKKIIHGDLKPDNVMLDDAGSVKVLDFGIARRVRGTHIMSTSPLTGTAGTPAYTAPEIHRGASPDFASDIFSMGVIFYELLSGIRPFRAGTLALEIEQILKKLPTSLDQYREDLPVPLSKLIDSMLEKVPEQRADLGEVRVVLEEVANRAPIPTPQRVFNPRPRRKRRRLIFLLPLIGLAILLGWLLFPKSSPNKLPSNALISVLPPVTRYQGPEDTAFSVGCAALLTEQLASTHLDQMQIAHFRKVIVSNGSPTDLRNRWGVNVVIKPAFERDGGKTHLELELARTGLGWNPRGQENSRSPRYAGVLPAA